MSDVQPEDDMRDGMPSDFAPRDALDWVLLQAQGGLSAAQRAAFHRWLDADPGNASAYRALARTYGLMDLHLREQRAWWRGPQRWATAASVLLLVWFAAVQLEPFLLGESYRTATGERRTVTLADGSLVHLNGASRIRVRFSEAARDIELEAGEALFEVAKNPARPFRVAAAGRIVQAIGTVFDVDRRSGQVEVAVREGVVAILESVQGNAPLELLRLEQGKAIDYVAEKPVGPVRAVVTDQVGAWRHDMLFFQDQTLADIVEALARRYPGRLSIPDPKLAAHRYSGTITLRERGATFRTLERAFAIQIRESGKDRFEFVQNSM